MNEPKKPRHDPHPELSSPILDRSLEAQISAAEQAVIVRDDRIRQHLGQVSHLVKTGPRRFVRKRVGLIAAVGAVGVGVAAYAWWRSRQSPRRSSSAAAPAPARAREERWSLLAFLPTAWRLLPKLVRSQVTKAVAGEIHHLTALATRLIREKAAPRADVDGPASRVVPPPTRPVVRPRGVD